MGRIEYRQKKNYRLVDVWKDIQDRYPDWCLTIVGDGPNRIDLEQRIADNNIKRVNIEGFKDPCEYYKRAKVIVLTSASEGLPLVIGEAMAHGVTPIVLASFDAVYDMIDDGINGIIVPMPYEKVGFADKLDELISYSDDQMKLMSENAKQKSKMFDLNVICDEWEQLFNRLMHE